MPAPGNPLVIEPTEKAELTIAGILGFCAFMALLLVAALVLCKPDEHISKWIGIALLLDIGALVVGLLIFITSKCGSRVRVAAAGGELDIGGNDH